MSVNRQGRLRDTGLLALLRGAVLFFPLLAVPAHAQETVTMTVDAAQSVKPISRYIYGINYGYFAALDPALNVTVRRMGGNRLTAYNWENNASNAGSDFIFQNDGYLGGGNTPGGAMIGPTNDAKANAAAMLLTVPINGYVAADKNGGGDVRNSGPNYLQTRFRQGRPVKGAPFVLNPDTTDAFVYQDEFVNWVKTTFPDSQQPGTLSPIWFSLDNEPDLWQETHLAIHPDPPLYAELVSKSTSYAAGIKAVAPNALVFGPVSYGFFGYVRLQGAPDANNRDFLDFYLGQMKSASDAAGKRLVDVLDLHWYPEAESSDGIRITGQETTATVVAARLQAPRSLWDPSYVENSWITRDWQPGVPINLLPLMAGKIATHNPGTKLAFTEYNYGAGQHISGGIAQADVLGIFGRQGVFAATQWPLQENADGTPAEPFVGGAFRMFRNFDGQKGSFGDTSVHAQTSNIPGTSIYASLDSTNAKRMVLVAINKTANPITAVINLNNAPAFKHATIYQLTSASPLPVANGSMALSNAAQFSYNMPPYSVSTLNLTASTPHDFNGDGKSDIAWRHGNGDVAVWLMNGATPSSVAGIGGAPSNWQIVGQRDFNGDGKHDLLWRDSGGNLALWFLNGAAVSSAAGLGNVATNWAVAGTGDANGDGKGDILWRSTTGDVAVWLMNGASIASAAGLGNVPTAWQIAGFADFNGDGKADILWRNTTTGDIAVWFLNGAAVGSAAGVGNLELAWSVVATGDFNGDGKADILWRTIGGNLAISLMNGAAVMQSAGLGSVPPSWIVTETGDFNGDGKSDILWREGSASGALAMWFMNGVQVSSHAQLIASASLWTIQELNAD